MRLRAWNGQAAFCVQGQELMIVVADTVAKDMLRFVAMQPALEPGTYRVRDLDRFDPASARAGRVLAGAADFLGEPGRRWSIENGALEVTAADSGVLRGRFDLALRSASRQVELADSASGMVTAAAAGRFTAVREDCPKP